jgi:DNA-binding transcriptional LysR family regulator
MVIAVGHNHPLARRRKISMAELCEHQWILSVNEMMLDTPLIGALKAEGLSTPERVVVSGSLQSRFSLLATNRFVTMFPHTLLPFGDFTSRVKVLKLELPRWTMPTMVLRLQERNPGPAAQKALELLLELGKPFQEGEG